MTFRRMSKMNRKNESKIDKKMTPKKPSKQTLKMDLKMKEGQTDLIPLGEYGDLMSSDEVSKFLKIEKDTLYKWVEKEIIPHYRITQKKILFNRKTICQWLNEKMVG